MCFYQAQCPCHYPPIYASLCLSTFVPISQCLTLIGRNPAQPLDEAPAKRSFHGAGYRLGESLDDPATPDPATVPAAQPAQEEEQRRRITFWRNGFTVDDGPLRDYKEPQNAAFLNTIRQGYAW